MVGGLSARYCWRVSESMLVVILAIGGNSINQSEEVKAAVACGEQW